MALNHSDRDISSSRMLNQFQRELSRSETARKYFSDYIMSLESTEDALKEINSEINFTESLDESFKAGLVNYDIIVVYMHQFFKSQYYCDYCATQAVSATPSLTRINSRSELALLEG